MFNPVAMRSLRMLGMAADFARINKRMHNKSFTADGQMAIVGGRNIGDEYFGYDDAVYVAARLARLIARDNEKISAKIARLPRYFSTPEIRLECKDDPTKFKIAEQAAAYFKSHYDCIDVDGVRIKFGDGWGLVRASNTQPVIVTRFEAKTAERLDEIRDLVLNKLREFGEFRL